MALAYLIGIGAFLGLRWDRYLLPTLIIGTLCSGLGLSAILRFLLPIPARMKVRAPVGARTGARP